MKKPVIGITTGTAKNSPPDDQLKDYQPYADAIRDAGGAPIFLCPSPYLDPQELHESLLQIDGLLLSGGRDVHPDNYNSRTEPGDEKLSTEELIAKYKMDCDPERDALELPLIRAAYLKGMPILGICRGFQVLNVALGGSLVKDVRTGLRHKSYTKEDEPEHKSGSSSSHDIQIREDSRLYEILGPDIKKVNSRHHQGVSAKEKSPRLVPVAFAPDGLIEGLEGLNHPWIIAVQWHPEKASDEYIYKPCKRLFKAFVIAAQEYAELP
ncbi:MAG: gamma-glutamyl-gamma-aminobutyrate hydrolase family protein [Armatimonadota bacterium]|nr:gamma-glutamyl-gamma-aminobutyrate hydrolase family protein [Armatimonadota bacterium]